MYNPSAFLITTGALTSIFNFFFGEYFRERERVYRLWLRIFAYDDLDSVRNMTEICSVMETKERMFRQARAFLVIMLLTLVGCFLYFQFYSAPYVDPRSPFFEPDAPHSHKLYSLVIGMIVSINALEMLYIKVAVYFRLKFPFVQFRKRVTGHARLSMIWQALDCPGLKRKEFARNRLPRAFYNHLDDPDAAFGHCFQGKGDGSVDSKRFFPSREPSDQDGEGKDEPACK